MRQYVIPTQAIIQACERAYAAQGFVKWADIGREFGISRQAVQARLDKAVERGELRSTDLDRFRSTSSRQRITQERAQLLRSTRFEIVLTPENATWLRNRCRRQGVRFADVINGLINVARETCDAYSFIHSDQTTSQSDDSANLLG